MGRQTGIEGVDKTVDFAKSFDFINSVDNLAYDKLCKYAVNCSEALIEILQETDDSTRFLASRQVDREVFIWRIKKILQGLHFNPAGDYYLAMLLPRDADVSSIHQRWKDLMLIYHPDRHANSAGPTASNSADCSRRINDVFSVLKDPKKKFSYDQRLDQALRGVSGRPSDCGRSDKKSLLELLRANSFAVAASLLFVAVAFIAGFYFRTASPRAASAPAEVHTEENASPIGSKADESPKGTSAYARLPRDEQPKRVSVAGNDILPVRKSIDTANSESSGEAGGAGQIRSAHLAEEAYTLISGLTQAYEKGDLNAYLSCYSRSAVEEDGLQYDEITNKYRNLFKSGTNHMTIGNIIIREGRDSIIVKGSFNADGYARTVDPRASKGTIEMTLAREAGKLKIRYFRTIAGTSTD